AAAVASCGLPPSIFMSSRITSVRYFLAPEAASPPRLGSWSALPTGIRVVRIPLATSSTLRSRGRKSGRRDFDKVPVTAVEIGLHDVPDGCDPLRRVVWNERVDPKCEVTAIAENVHETGADLHHRYRMIRACLKNVD